VTATRPGSGRARVCRVLRRRSTSRKALIWQNATRFVVLRSNPRGSRRNVRIASHERSVPSRER